MNDTYQVREWLQRAFTDQVSRLNECYYYDRNANEFYSVFITDYFLTGSTSTEEFSNSPYSKDELAVLSERIERVENNDPSIVGLPQLTLAERKKMLQAFLEEQQVCDPALHTLIETENGRTDLDFNNLLSVELNESWQSFKWGFVQEKVDCFCKLQGINIETVALWTEKKMTTMTFDLTEMSKPEIISSRPWWKFW